MDLICAICAGQGREVEGKAITIINGQAVCRDHMRHAASFTNLIDSVTDANHINALKAYLRGDTEDLGGNPEG